MSTTAVWHPVTDCDLCGSTRFEPYLNRAVDGRPLVRCDGCGLVLLSPRPDAAGIAEWYSENYFSGSTDVGMGANYLSYAEAGIRHGTEAFFQFISRVRPRGLRLLEVGCGGGAFLVQCRNSGADVAGLEVSEFAAERLRRQYHLDVRLGTVEVAPFEPASFDLVAFTDVVEHVPSPSTFFEGIQQLLKPGGRVYGLMPNIGCVSHYGTGWAGFRQHAEHLYYFGSEQLTQYLAKADLRPIEIWTWGEPWEPTASVAASPRTVQMRSLRNSFKNVPGLVPAVRTVQRWRSRFNSNVREREARYRQGAGHDLYFLAEKRA